MACLPNPIRAELGLFRAERVAGQPLGLCKAAEEHAVPRPSFSHRNDQPQRLAGSELVPFFQSLETSDNGRMKRPVQ